MQKRRIFLCIVTVVLVLMLAMCLFVACNDDDQKKPNDDNKGDDTPTTITITYDFNDGVTPNRTVTVGYDEHLKAEHIPSVSRVGYTFDGWFKGEERVRTNNHYTESFTAVARYTLKDVRVIFIDGETRTPVTIKYGQKVAEESFPEIDDQEGRNFLGWFIKDTDPAVEFDKDYVVNSETDIEVVATYETDKFNVTFKLNADDEDAYKTVSNIEHGSVIATADLPQDPTTEDPTMKFEGWVDPDDDTVVFDKTAPVTEEKTYVAKFVKFKYAVTFKFAPEANREDEIHYLEFDAQGNATLGALDIPQARPLLTDPPRSFIGFYTSTNVKAVAGMTITADTTFDAYYVGAIDYKGAWVDETNKIVAYFDTVHNTVSVGTEIEERAFTVDNGTLKYTTYGSNWTFTFFKGKITAVKTPSSGSATTYNFTQGKAVDYQGVYSQDRTAKLIVGEGGFIANFNGAVQYGKMTKTGNTYSISIVDGENTIVIPATVDSKGSLVIAESDEYANKYTGLWVKGEFANAYTGTDSSKITKFTSGANSVYLYVPAEGAYKYVTPDKDIEANAIVTFTYDTNKTIIARFTSNTAYEIAGAERGTYTAEDTNNHVTYTIVLDGFGKATFDATGLPDDQNYLLGEWDYRAKSDNFVVINKLVDSDNLMFYGVNLNKTNNSFTFEEPGNFTGVYSLMQGGTFDLTLTFDGFGSVIAYNVDANLTRYGTYVVDDGANTVTVAGIGGAESQFTDGVYAILQNGDVLSVTNTITQTVEYWGVKGASLGDVDLNSFVGYWVAPGDFGDYTLNITLNNNVLSISKDNSAVVSGTVNADNSVTFTDEYNITYTIALNGEVSGANTIKVTGGNIGDDGRVYTYTVAVPDAFIGTWLDDTNEYSLVINKTEVQIKLGSAAELVNATLVSVGDASIVISVDSVNYTVSFANDNLQIVISDNTITLAKAIITDSKWYGTWKNSEATIELVITSGGITWNGSPVTDISVDNYGDLSFTYNDEQWTFEDYRGFTLKKGAYPSYEMTKEAQGGDDPDPTPVQIDASLEGTWVSTSDSTVKIVIDTTANTITYLGKEATGIRVDSSTSSPSYYFTVDGAEYNVYKAASSSTLTVEYNYDRTTFSKEETTPTPTYFMGIAVGTYTSSDGELTLVVSEGSISINGSAYTSSEIKKSGSSYEFYYDSDQLDEDLEYSMTIYGTSASIIDVAENLTIGTVSGLVLES